jgi:hypothetical protein
MEIRLGIINGLILRRSGWIRLGWSWGLRWKPEGDAPLFSERAAVSSGRSVLGYRFRVLEPLPAHQAAAQRRA